MSWTAFYAKAFNRHRIEGGAYHTEMFVRPVVGRDSIRDICRSAKHHIHWMCASTAPHPMDVSRLLLLAYTNTLPHEFYLSVLY